MSELFLIDLLDRSYYRGFDDQLENKLESPLDQSLSKPVHNKISIFYSPQEKITTKVPPLMSIFWAFGKQAD